MTDARVIRPASAQEPLRPGRITVVEVCHCGSRYVYGGRPDPVLIGAWRKAHEGCEG